MRRYCEAVKVDVRRRMSPPQRQSVAKISAELQSCRAAQKSLSDRSRELNSAQRKDPLDVVSQLPKALAD